MFTPWKKAINRHLRIIKKDQIKQYPMTNTIKKPISNSNQHQYPIANKQNI